MSTPIFRFDPLLERRWTLPMAIAWIAHRSGDAVAEYVATPGQSHSAWLMALPIEDEEDFSEAFEALKHAIRIGSVIVSGRNSSGERSDVSVDAWEDLQVTCDDDLRTDRAVDRLFAPHIIITDLRVLSDQVMSVWPAAQAKHEAFDESSTAVSAPRRRTGPAPALREGVAARMLGDLHTKKTSPQALDSTTGDALAAEYGCSRGTAVVARTVALSKFGDH